MNRWDVLIRILKDRPHSFGVELGVNFGETTCALSRSLPDLVTIIGVDPYINYSELRSTADRGKSYSRLLANLSSLDQTQNKVSLIRLPSHMAADLFVDEIFDWIFIDANHRYAYVKADLQSWLPKVKKEGVIAGHDYNHNEVRAAVAWFFPTVTIEPSNVWWTVK